MVLSPARLHPAKCRVSESIQQAVCRDHPAATEVARAPRMHGGGAKDGCGGGVAEKPTGAAEASLGQEICDPVAAVLFRSLDRRLVRSEGDMVGCRAGSAEPVGGDDVCSTERHSVGRRPQRPFQPRRRGRTSSGRRGSKPEGRPRSTAARVRRTGRIEGLGKPRRVSATRTLSGADSS